MKNLLYKIIRAARPAANAEIEMLEELLDSDSIELDDILVYLKEAIEDTNLKN